MIESVIVGAIVVAAALYVALKLIGVTNKGGQGCGGECGSKGDGLKGNPRLGKTQELVQVEVDRCESSGQGGEC